MPNKIVYGTALTERFTTIPDGHTLGELRVDETGKREYRLFYNAGGASIPTGYCFSRSYGGTGLYSVTVTTVTETGNTGAAGCNPAGTVPTATYFWGAVYGHPFQLVCSNVSIATDIAVCTAGGGKVMVATVPTFNVVAVNLGDYSTSVTGIATNNTDTAGGRYFVMFERTPGWYKKV